MSLSAPSTGSEKAPPELIFEEEDQDVLAGTLSDADGDATINNLRVRFHIIRNEQIENVGKSQSCMVSKRIIWKQTVEAPTPRQRPGDWLTPRLPPDLLPEQRRQVLQEVRYHFKPCMTEIYLHI